MLQIVASAATRSLVIVLTKQISLSGLPNISKSQFAKSPVTFLPARNKTPICWVFSGRVWTGTRWLLPPPRYAPES